jgi:hypothetical protein
VSQLTGEKKLTTWSTGTQVQCRCTSINLYCSNFPLYSEGARAGAFKMHRKIWDSAARGVQGTGIRFKKVVLKCFLRLGLQPVHFLKILF